LPYPSYSSRLEAQALLIPQGEDMVAQLVYTGYGINLYQK
jgi:hypothetical protein